MLSIQASPSSSCEQRPCSRIPINQEKHGMPSIGALGGNSGSVNVLPSFFVIGPPRTGTSWLHGILTAHAVLPFPTKETRFFDVHFQRGLAWYMAHFPSSTDSRPIAEIAPTYFA